MNGNQYPIRQGGLMRCCIQTILGDIATRTAGEVIPCNHCNSAMVLEMDKWRWLRDAGWRLPKANELDVRLNKEQVTFAKWRLVANNCRSTKLTFQEAVRAWNNNEDPTQYASAK